MLERYDAYELAATIHIGIAALPDPHIAHAQALIIAARHLVSRGTVLLRITQRASQICAYSTGILACVNGSLVRSDTLNKSSDPIHRHLKMCSNCAEALTIAFPSHPPNANKASRDLLDSGQVLCFSPSLSPFLRDLLDLGTPPKRLANPHRILCTAIIVPIVRSSPQFRFCCKDGDECTNTIPPSSSHPQ